MDGPLSLGVSLSGVAGPDGTRDARVLFKWAAGLGLRWLQLDATMPGVRPRELDRSARRDLASTIRRDELGLSGIDLFIPPRHFVQNDTVDRAVSALVGAIELAAELQTLVTAPAALAVAVELPKGLGQDVLTQIAASAAKGGVIVADHARPEPTVQAGTIGPGIDPAAMLAAGEDVFDVLTRMPHAPVQARLSDTQAGARVPAGSANGKLDLVEYASALGVRSYASPVVIDLRGLRVPMLEAPKVVRAWESSVRIA
jgi:sugar phosphate isomerase/epimerase